MLTSIQCLQHELIGLYQKLDLQNNDSYFISSFCGLKNIMKGKCINLGFLFNLRHNNDKTYCRISVPADLIRTAIFNHTLSNR